MSELKPPVQRIARFLNSHFGTVSVRLRCNPTIIGGVGTGDAYEQATVISLIPASPLKVRYLPLRLRIVCYSIGPLRQ